MFFKRKKSEDLPNDDDFLDDDDFGFGDSEGGFESFNDGGGARSPVNEFTGSFKTAISSSARDPQVHKKIIRESLPASYVHAYEGAELARNEIRQGYGEIKEETKKQVNDFKKKNGKVIEKIGSLVPGRAGKKITDWGQSVESTHAGNEPDYEQMGVTAQLGEIFGNVANIQSQEKSTEVAMEGNAESKIQTKIAQDSQEALLGSNNYLSRLVEYQDNIGSKYQRKMIELTFRQLFVSRKVLDETQQFKQLSEEAFGKITKNTALPDAVKLRDTEIIAKLGKEKFLGSLTDDMSNSLGEMTRKYGSRVFGKAVQTISTVGQTATDVTGQLGDMFVGDDDSMGASISPMEFIISQVADKAAAKATDAAIKAGTARLKESSADPANKEFIERQDQLIRMAQASGSRYFNDKVLGGQTGIKFLDSLTEWSGAGQDRKKFNGRIGGSFVEDMNSSAFFDNRTHRSINDIIPELLAKIHTETRKLNGEGDAQDLKYDWELNRFSTADSILKRTNERIFDKNRTDSMDKVNNEILSAIDPDGKLSDRARNLITRHAAIAKMTDKHVSLTNFINPNNPNHDSEIANFVTKEYGATYNLDSGEQEEAFFFGDGSSKAFNEANIAFAQGGTDLGRTISDPLSELLKHAKVSGLAGLDELSFVSQGKDGEVSYDAEKYYDAILARQEADLASKARKLDSTDILDTLTQEELAESQAGGGGALSRWLKRAGVAGAGLGATGLASAATVGGDLALSGLSMQDGSTLSLVVGGTLAGSAIAANLFGKSKTGEHQLIGESGTGDSARVRGRDHVTTSSGQLETTNDWLSKIYTQSENRDYGENLSAVNSQLGGLSEQLKLMAANMRTGPGIDLDILNTLSADQRGILGAYNLGKGAVGGILGKGSKLIKSYYKGVGKLGIKGLGAGKGLFKWGKDTIGGLTGEGIHPIYIKNRKVPSLTAHGIKNQDYIDAATGKVIQGIEDITGRVTNADGTITYITEEDFTNIGVEERTQSMFGKAVGAATTVAKVAFSPYKFGGQSVKKLFDWADGFSFPSGIYLMGEESPRLDLLSLKRGYYRLASDGSVVKSLRDLTGDVIDRNGNVVLTLDQITSGIYDKTGEKIDLATSRIGKGVKSLSGKGWSAVKTIGSMGVDALGTVATWGIDLFKGAKNRLAKWREDKEFGNLFSFGVFTTNQKQYEEVKIIRQLVEAKFGKNETKYNDRDGDGDRDGSFKDLKEQAEKEDQRSVRGMMMDFFSSKKSKPEEKESLFSSLMGGMGNVLTSVVGTAIKVGLPMFLGKLGIDALVNKIKNPEVIAEDDPRLDPTSDQYDPDLKAGEQDPTLLNKAGQWHESLGTVGTLASLLIGGSVFGKAMKLPGLLLKGGSKKLGMGLRKMGRRNFAEGGRGGKLGGVARIGKKLGRGLGTVARSSAVRGLLMGGLRLGAGLVSGPVGWALLAGTAAYAIGSWAYKRAQANDVGGDALLRLRISSYGYDYSNKEKVAFFLSLERYLADHLESDKKGVFISKSFEGDKVMEMFKISPDDPEEVERWKMYFKKRFMPVFLTFATYYHAHTGKYDISVMDDTLDPAQRLETLNQTLFTRKDDNPYDVTESGFGDEVSVDTDAGDVKSIYKIVRVSVEKEYETTKGKYLTKEDAKNEEDLKKREEQIKKLADERDKKEKSLISKITESFSENNPYKWGHDAGTWLREKIAGLFGNEKETGSEPGTVGYNKNAGGNAKMSGKPGESFNPQVASAILWGANELGIDPNYLASVISFETGGTFDTNARNPTSSATGLIQFMDGADGKSDKLYYGMTRDQFGSLSYSEQMKYVVQFFKSKGLKPGAGLGAVYDAVTGTGYKRGSEAYRLNKVWDANNDGVISPGESVTSGYFKKHMKDYFGNFNGTASANSGTVTPGTGPIKTNNVPGKTSVDMKKALDMSNIVGVGPKRSNKVPTPWSAEYAENAVEDGREMPSSAAQGSGMATQSSTEPSTPPPSSKPYIAAWYIQTHALNSSSGYCARYVADGLDKARYNFSRNPSAYMYARKLTLVKAGFVEIAGNTPWQIGDIMVFNRNSARPHGHIQIYTTIGWVSDFKQNTFIPYRTNCPPFKLFRDGEYLNGARAGKDWVPATEGNVGGPGTGGEVSPSGQNNTTGPGGEGFQPSRKILTADELFGRTAKEEAEGDGKGKDLVEDLTETASAKTAKVDGKAVESNKAKGTNQKPKGLDKSNMEVATSGLGIESTAFDPVVKRAKVSVSDDDGLKRDREVKKTAQELKVERVRAAQREQQARAKMTSSVTGLTNDILDKQLRVQQDLYKTMTSIDNNIQQAMKQFSEFSRNAQQMQTVSNAGNAVAPAAVNPKAIEALQEPVSLLKQ